MKFKKILSVLLCMCFAQSAAFAADGGTALFTERFNSYVGSLTERVAPSGWSIADYSGTYGTDFSVTDVTSALDDTKAVRLAASGTVGKVSLRKNFSSPFGQSTVVTEQNVCVGNGGRKKNIEFNNSSASGATFTKAVVFDADGVIKLNNGKINTDIRYESDKWYTVTLLSENESGKVYISVFIDGLAVAERFEITSPTGNIGGVRYSLTVGTSDDSMCVDNVRLYVPGDTELAHLRETEAEYGTVNETEFPEPQPSDSYTVTANGTAVFAEKFADISYADFDWQKNISVTVTANEPVSSYNISPHSFGIEAAVSGNSITFTLDRPRKLSVSINGGERLFIFAMQKKDYSAYTSGENVINVIQSGADAQGKVINTAVLQECLDRAAATNGGGVVYFPSGKYLTGVLRVGSNTTIYLEKGAVLMAASVRRGFKPPFYTRSGNTLGTMGLLFFDEANNSKLTGRGTVDGNGSYLRGRYDITLRDVLAYKSTNLTVEDVILRNSAAWNSHIMFGDEIAFKHTRIINDPSVPNTDGIDPDSTVDMLIENVFSYCSDDSVAVKTSSGYYDADLPTVSRNIVVRRGVFITLKSSLKVGTESCADIRDITFEDNDIVESIRPLAIMTGDGGNVKNALYTNNRVESILPSTRYKGIKDICEFSVSNRDMSGSISDVTVKKLSVEENADASIPYSYIIYGASEESGVNNVTFSDVTIGGAACSGLDFAQRYTKTDYSKNITYRLSDGGDGCTVRVLGNASYDGETVSALIENETGAEVVPMCIAAAFDDSGSLIKAGMSRVRLCAYGEKQISVALGVDRDRAAVVRLFFFNDMSSIAPLGKSVTIN